MIQPTLQSMSPGDIQKPDSEDLDDSGGKCLQLENVRRIANCFYSLHNSGCVSFDVKVRLYKKTSYAHVVKVFAPQ